MARRRSRGRAPDSEALARGRKQAGQPASAALPLNANRMPGSPANVLALQRTVGNACVSRALASRPQLTANSDQPPLHHAADRRVQRDPAPYGPAPAAQAGAAPQGQAEGPAKPLIDPMWAAISKLIAEQLGDDKIKEYAKSLAGKSVDLLIAQVKDASNEKDFISKSQIELLGTMLSEQAKKDAETLAASDAAKKFRDQLVTVTKENPGVVVAAAIAAAAVAYLTNADIPEISKKIDILKGLTGEGKLDLGKVQQLTVQQASAALKFSSTHFSAGISGAYAGEGDKKGGSGEANVALGDKEVQFKGSLKLNPDGTAKVDLGQAIEVDKLKLDTGVSIANDKMVAIIAVKVGDKDTYVSGKTTVSQDGKASIDLGFKAGDWKGSAGVTGLGGGAPEGEASVTGTNIFGVKGLDANGKIKFGAAGVTSASGGVEYGKDTREGRAFISFKAESVSGDKGGPPIGAQGVIGLGFRFGK